MEILKRILKSALAIFLLILIVWIVWSFLFNRITTTFNVTANTERVKFTTMDSNNSRLTLYDATIANYDSVFLNNFEGSLELKNNVDVVIERISEGPIIISLSCRTCSSVGNLYSAKSDDSVYKADNYLDITIDDVQDKAQKGISYIFKIDGKIESGRNVALELIDESNAILRNGNVVMIGSSEYTNDYFQAGTTQLFLGDRLVFDNQQSKGFGFVVINERAGMEACYRVLAKEARIIRPGPIVENSGQVISATALDRLTNDPFFRGISFLIGVLITLFTALTFWIDVKTFSKPENS